MSNTSALIDLGLSEPEATLYLALLKLGGSRASTVAKEVGLKRTTIYALLKSLAQKGFVTMYYRHNRQYYYADKPERVAHFYEKKLDAFTALIPALETLDKKQLQATGLRFIETLPELKKFYAAILEEYKNKSYTIIGSSRAWEGLEPEFFIQYRKDRAKNKIKTRLLMTADSRGHSPEDPRLLRAVKFLPKKYSFKSTIDIYKDKVLVVRPQISSLAIVIEVPAMVDVFRSVFEIMWDTTK